MNERLFVALTGHPGTGKSTIAKELHNTYGFQVFEGSKLLKSIALAKGIELKARQSYADFHMFEQKQRNCPGFLTEEILRSPVDAPVAQVGLRTRSGCDSIRQLGSRGYIIATSCPPEICVARMDASDPKNATTIESYLSDLSVDATDGPYGTNTAYCIDNADFTIDTSRSKDHSLGQLCSIMGIILASR